MGSPSWTQGLTHWETNRVPQLSPKSVLRIDPKDEHVSVLGCPNPKALSPSPAATSLSGDTIVPWALPPAEPLSSLAHWLQLLKWGLESAGDPEGSGRIPAVSLIQRFLNACYGEMTEQDLCGMLGLLSPTVCLLWGCNLLMWGEEEEGGNKKKASLFFFKIPVENVK